MYKVTPPALLSNAPTAPANADTCAIVDASTLLYQPALRAAVIQEQVALLAARLAIARWTSAHAAPFPEPEPGAQPFRAAFYARAQDDFFAWIERGGMWAPEAADGAVDEPMGLASDSSTVE
jgi:hypothetical protein